MIRHIVAVRFKDSVNANVKADLFGKLEALKGVVPGVLGFHAGPNISPETPVVHGFLDAFWFDFADEAARDAYLIHPDHQAVGSQLVANSEGGVDGILVVDLKV